MAVRRMLVFGLLLLLGSCGEPEPIRLGFIGGVTGRYADFGVSGRNGVVLAVEERNQAGGIGGRRIELIVRDDMSDPEKAALAVDELLALGVKAIVGPMFSSMAVAVAPKVNEARVLTVGITSTTTQLANADDFFFRVVGTTDIYARNMARHHRERLGLRRTALLLDVSNREYTDTYARIYAEEFGALGGKVVATVRFDSRRVTKYAEITQQLLHARPDSILLACTSVDAALVAQSVRRLNRTVQLSATGFAASGRLLELGSGAAEGMLIEQFTDVFDESPNYRRFVKAFMARFGDDPGYTGTLGYDAAQVVLAALARNPDGSRLKAELDGMRRVTGAQQEIEFDAFGDPRRQAYLSVVRDGRFAPAEIAPDRHNR